MEVFLPFWAYGIKIRGMGMEESVWGSSEPQLAKPI